MPSNGQEICKWLKNHFPAAKLSQPQWDYWARDLAREEWETPEATEALRRMVQEKPPEFMPSLPAIQSVITAHHRRLAGLCDAQSPRQEEPPRGECARQVEVSMALVKDIFARAVVIKRPGWATANSLKLASWRWQHGVPPPIGPEQRAQRDRLPPALIEEERQVYRAINKGVRMNR